MKVRINIMMVWSTQEAISNSINSLIPSGGFANF